MRKRIRPKTNALVHHSGGKRECKRTASYKRIRPKTNAVVHHSGGKKSGTESKITLYTKQVEFIDSASFPRRLGSFMREKVTGKILIVKSRITYLITIQYCLGVHAFPK